MSVGPDHAAAWRALPIPSVLLDRQLVIRDASTSYLQATVRRAGDIVGRHLFEAFPDNPGDPSADGVAALGASLTAVLDREVEDRLPLQRYDLLVPGDGWVERHWNATSRPVRDLDGEVVGAVTQVEDVTAFRDVLADVVARYTQRVDDEVGDPDPALHDRFASHVASTLTGAAAHRELVDEVWHLRRALTTRATIDQAKGVVIAHRRCSPDEAFDHLRQLSQDHHVKLRDVAAALLLVATGGHASGVFDGEVADAISAVREAGRGR